MKATIKSVLAASALSAMFAGQAFAMVSVGDVNRQIHSAVSNSAGVLALVNGNTATLTGVFSDESDKYAAIRAAQAVDGIDRVINSATVSN